MKFNVIEKFVSINGEGIRSGHLTTFVRFKGCNLRCVYCDSSYSYDETETAEIMDENQIVQYCRSTGTHMVTLAGGEPMIQPGINDLVALLCKEGFSVEIETNGSVDISQIASIQQNRPHITLDYKTLYSGMESHNLMKNYDYLTKNDAVKFVVGTQQDLQNMVSVVEMYDLLNKTNVLISPVFDVMQPLEIVRFMILNKLNGYKMQMQIHKFIWDPEERGV